MIWSIAKFVFGIQDDNREQYYYDEDDQPLALLIEGDLEINDLGIYYNTPDHERYIHDGTPHRDPAVYERSKIDWLFGFVPRHKMYMQRYYSLHVSEDGRHADIDRIQDMIDSAQLKYGQNVQIVTMDERIRRRVERVENKTQRARGVPRWLLKPWRSQ